MKVFLKLILTALAALILSELMSGIYIHNYITAVLVALTIAILNMLVRPILIILTLPVTILTLGLFLFIVNALIVLLAGKLVSGFEVYSFLSAMFFSLLLSVFRSFLFKIFLNKKKQT